MAKKKGGVKGMKELQRKVIPMALNAGGGIIANFAGSKFDSIPGIPDALKTPKARYAALLALGLGGLWVIKNNPQVENIINGFLTVSAMKLVGAFVPQLAGLSGIESDVINGLYDDVITEDDIEGIINGYDDEVSGENEFVGDDGDDY